MRDAGDALRLHVRKRTIPGPAFHVPRAVELLRARTTGTMGIDADLMEGARTAVRNMITWLVEEHGLSREDAYVLCSLAGDLQIHEIVDAGVWNVGMTMPLGSLRLGELPTRGVNAGAVDQAPPHPLEVSPVRCDHAPHHRKDYESAGAPPPDYRLTCIFIDRDYRRKGLTSIALHGALDLIAQAGGGVVEGYPRISPTAAGSATRSSTTAPAPSTNVPASATSDRRARTTP